MFYFFCVYSVSIPNSIHIRVSLNLAGYLLKDVNNSVGIGSITIMMVVSQFRVSLLLHMYTRIHFKKNTMQYKGYGHRLKMVASEFRKLLLHAIILL